MKIKPFETGICAGLMIVISAVSAAAQVLPRREIYVRPSLCPFNVNKGAESTPTQQVTLYCDTNMTNATEYRASERQDFANTGWAALRSEVPFTLSAGDGVKTIYFQLRNAGATTGITNKSIKLATRKEFIIAESRSAQLEAQGHGFTFLAKALDMNSKCEIGEDRERNLITTDTRGTTIFTGAKCDFILFGNRALAAGWTVKDYVIEGNSCSGDSSAGYNLVEWPSAGGTWLKLNIHTWAEPQVPSLGLCFLKVGRIVLEGPASASGWSDAFR